MAYAPTISVSPSERRSLGVAREITAGTGVTPAVTVPVKGFVPEDKVTGLLDESLRSSMSGMYGYVQGVYVADVTIGSSPVYGDSIGHFLYNILGDYTASGTTTGTSTTINNTGGYAAGTSGSVTVTAGTAFTAGYVQISDSGPANSEIVHITASTATTITIDTVTPTRFAHADSATVTQVTGPYTHVFSLLNGTGNAQPPTHTLTDMNYLNSVSARWYPFSCMSELTITGNAEQFFMWSGKATGFSGQIPAATPAVSVSAVKATPSWNSTIGIGGTVTASPVYNVMEYEYTLTREVEAYFTANGQQNPYTIGRGKFTAAGKFNFGPASPQASQSSPYAAADFELLYLLDNLQPQVQAVATNGLAGTSLVSVQIDTQVAAFSGAVIEPGKALLGYNDTVNFQANTTNAGQSAGYSPIQVTLTNNYPTY